MLTRDQIEAVMADRKERALRAELDDLNARLKRLEDIEAAPRIAARRPGR
jgi:hypothetical protein